MTNKEIAERLREILKEAGIGDYETLLKFQRLADTLDPPKPEPGTVVWFRSTESDVWYTGIASERIVITPEADYKWEEIEWRPARILAPGEVAVKVPPVSEWPKRDGNPVAEASLRWHYEDNDEWMTDYAGVTVTRAEAEEIER